MSFLSNRMKSGVSSVWACLSEGLDVRVLPLSRCASFLKRHPMSLGMPPAPLSKSVIQEVFLFKGIFPSRSISNCAADRCTIAFSLLNPILERSDV
ncbi:MAG: hypothetical protein ACJAQT_001655 [Akkermansiaceae bacterium]|jgi:hypothetical protein